MPYPWPSFGTFLFREGQGERPLPGTDAGWQATPSVISERALGSTVNTVTVMALGSQERSFELLMPEDRYKSLKALVGTTALFTDWAIGTLTIDSRNAFLALVQAQGDLLLVSCEDGTRWHRRIHVQLISQ